MDYTLDYIDRIEQEARDARNQLETANDVADKWRDEANKLKDALEQIASLDIGTEAEDAKYWQAHQFFKAQRLAQQALETNEPKGKG